jgi:serine/threonine protein kinase
MDVSNENDPPLAVYEQLAASCEAIESAFRSSEAIDIEPLVLGFPAQYQDMVRIELQGVLRELSTGPIGASEQDRSDSKYHAMLDYTVIRPLAQGGMGRVITAWDEELSRRVALKEIHPSCADDQRYRQRFLQESIITAKLEHPGILPIYSRGVNSDEQPFFTMKLIDGQNTKSLHTAIQDLHSENRSSAAFQSNLKGLLRRLIDVCHTIGYAHSQYVCHRDLKPSNVLLGPFGETFVVDWGLAKIFHSTDPISDPILSFASSFTSPTHTSLTDGVGTRGFIAPEAVSGDAIEDWPRLDIFSLGAILYCMLTGLAPRSKPSRNTHGEDHLEGQREFGTNESDGDVGIPRPSPMASYIPKAIESICIKAMSQDPRFRYATAMELAEDLDRFLTGQPVSVHREGFLDRATRWLNQNKTLAITSLALALFLAIFTSVIALQQSYYSASLEEKSLNLSDSLDRELRLKQQETSARELAQVQGELASKREALALQALKTYTDVITTNEMLKNTQQLSLRRELLEKPLAIFEQIEQDEMYSGNPSWEYFAQLARMSEELAKLSFEYGDRDQSIRWIEQSIQKYKKLLSVTEEPGVTEGKTLEASRRIAHSQVSLAGLYRLQGTHSMSLDRQLSSECFLKANDILSNTKPVPGWSERLLSEKANLHVARGILAAENGDAQGMSDYFAQAIAEREELLRIAWESEKQQTLSPNSTIATREFELEMVRQDRAHLGLTLRCGDIESHFQQFSKHIDFLKQQINLGASLESNRRALSWTQRHLGFHLLNYGQPEKGLEIMQAALDFRRQMTILYPSVTRYKIDLATTAFELSRIDAKFGRFEQAIEFAKEGIGVYRILFRELPTDSTYQVNLVADLHFLGHLYLTHFLDDEARKSFEESLELANTLLASNPNIPVLKALYPELIWHRAQIYALQAEWKDASEALEKHWNARTATEVERAMTDSERKKSLDLWFYCSLRAGNTIAAERVGMFVKETKSDDPESKPSAAGDDANAINRLKRQVVAAQAILFAADKALIAGSFEQAIELEQQALAEIEPLVEWTELQMQEKKLNRNELFEVWDLTLRNPYFTTVRNPRELDRWPSEDRDAWQSVWQKIHRLEILKR